MAFKDTVKNAKESFGKMAKGGKKKGGKGGCGSGKKC